MYIVKFKVGKKVFSNHCGVYCLKMDAAASHKAAQIMAIVQLL